MLVTPKRYRGLVLVLSIIVVGTLFLIFSKAATSTASIEPENGILSTNASKIANALSSAGSHVRFKAPSTQASWWKPAADTKWQWVLEGGITVNSTNLARFDMYDIDLTDAIPSTMTQEVVWANGDTRTVTWNQGSNGAKFTALKAAGKKVICYMDIGAYETYEPDAELFPGTWSSNNTRNGVAYNGPPAYAGADVIGGDSQDSAGGVFEGEFWLDIRESSWQYWAPIMWARLEVAKRIGCDGVEGDQINSYGNDPTFNITQAHSLRLYREYYYQAHVRGLTAISKNGIELTSQQMTDPTNIAHCTPGLCVPDGILNEECQQYGECSALDAATGKGLWVGQVEYRNTATAVCPDANSSGRMAMKKPENYSVTENILFACWEQ